MTWFSQEPEKGKANAHAVAKNTCEETQKRTHEQNAKKAKRQNAKRKESKESKTQNAKRVVHRGNTEAHIIPI